MRHRNEGRCSARQRPSRHGFTVLEVTTVVVIIAILAVIGLGVAGHVRKRARRVQCMANLRQLHLAAEMYVQQHGTWPQIRRMEHPTPSEYASIWIDTLAPFGAQRSSWICPAVQELIRSAYAEPENARLDYVAMPFDDKPDTRHRWARQPWFIEVADVHGSGNLLIFADGSISDLKAVVRESGSGR